MDYEEPQLYDAFAASERNQPTNHPGRRNPTIELLKAYYRLTKPERTLTNVLTAVAGYLLASQWHIHWGKFVALLFGTTLIIASACVLNNYIDRGLDKKMERTKRRALVSGKISIGSARIYAGALGVIGFGTLIYTNWLTFTIGVVAFVGYVVAYGWAKRHTIYGTLVGTIPGGASLAAGYTAFSNKLDFAAILLFLAMAAWQLAHFYSIAIYRLKDYKKAKLPIWSVQKGIASTRRQIYLFIGLFILANLLMTYLGYAGIIYFLVSVGLGIEWLRRNLENAARLKDADWARQSFRFSLIVVCAWSVAIALGTILP